MKEVVSRILNLLDLALYLRKKLVATLILSKYRLKLLSLTKKKFTRRNRLVIKDRYFATITNDRQRIFDLIEQDKYSKNRVKALKELLRACNENRKKLASTLLMLIVYDVMTIAKILSFLVVYLGIEITILTSSIIDYRDESTNLEHLVPKT